MGFTIPLISRRNYRVLRVVIWRRRRWIRRFSCDIEGIRKAWKWCKNKLFFAATALFAAGIGAAGDPKEYALGMVLMVLGGIVAIIYAFAWDGFGQHPRWTIATRALLALGGMISLPISILWMLSFKPVGEPWSNFLRGPALADGSVEPLKTSSVGPGRPSSPQRPEEASGEDLAPASPGPEPSENPPRCDPRITISSEVVSRIYFRQPIPTTGESTNAIPYLQELFYDWHLMLVPSCNISGLTVRIIDQELFDGERVKVSPPNATVTEAEPEWLSGFAEPRIPDFYVRTVGVSGLAKNQNMAIVIRRPFEFQLGNNEITLDPAFVNRTVEIFTGSFENSFKPDSDKEIIRIGDQFSALVQRVWPGTAGPLRIVLNPDEAHPPPAEGQIETTLEVRCKDEGCLEFLLGQMELRATPTSQ